MPVPRPSALLLATLALGLAACGAATVTSDPVVQVAVTPATADLPTGGSQQFTAAVTGSADTVVTWSVAEGSPAGGTVSEDGRYAAPGEAGTFHVEARSRAAPSRVGAATVVVRGLPVVVVTVSPGSAALLAGQEQQFSASVTGSADTAVTWSVTEAGGGTVSATGRYTAPAAVGTYHVVARSQADPGKSAAALVTVTEVAVSIAPTSAAILTGQAQQFTAAVTGSANQAVTWSVGEGGPGGSVTATGRYTAPGVAGSYHVVATSVADPGKAATALVTVSGAPVVVVSLLPTSAALLAGRTQQFAATVTGTADQAVTWSVQEAGGGTITAGGRYTAPAAAGTYHVVATSVADPGKAATATVTVTVVAVSVAPTSAALLDGRTRQFAATVTGSPDTAVTWSVTEAGGGTVTAGGLYTAPAAAGTYHVVATSVADPGKAATATVTVSVVAVSVAQTAAALLDGRTRQFAATVTGSADTAVTWSVQEAGGGTVTAGGLYTAPAAAGTYHVVATSAADPRRSASATVTVGVVGVAIAPTSASLATGQAQQFTPTVTGTADTAVTWAVQEGSPAGGTVSATGLYTAPATAGTYHVVARSAADTGKSATATVTVTSTSLASIWTTSLGVGVVDGGPRGGTWDLDPAGHPDTIIVGQVNNTNDTAGHAIDLYYGPIGAPLTKASVPVSASGGIFQLTTIMDTQAYRLHALAPRADFQAMIYVRIAVTRGADGRISGFTKEAEVALGSFSGAGNGYDNALYEVVDGAGNHRLAGIITVDRYTGSTTDVLGFVTSVAGGVAPTTAAQFTGFGGAAALTSLTTFTHTGGPGALDGAYGCMASLVQQPTTGTIYAFAAVGLHGASTQIHRYVPIPLAAAGGTSWAPAAAVNYSTTGTGSNYATALPTGHVYWSWEDGVDSRLSRINPDGSVNLAPLSAIGFRAEYDPGACHVAVQGDRVMTILHEWGTRARVYLATGVNHDAAGTAAAGWSYTQLQDPTTSQYPLNATGIDGLGQANGHWWSAAISANYNNYTGNTWVIVAPFP